MKKILTICLTLLMAGSSAMAQQTVTGTVVDSKGNPVQGALVETKDGTYTTTTGFDGTFSLNAPYDIKKVIARYAGYNTEMKKAKDGMKIKLGRAGWLNEPAKSTWFLGVQCLLPEAKFKGITPGINFGWVKKVGFYCKFYLRPGHDYYDDLNKTPGELTGQVSRRYISGSLGAVVRLGCPIYLYAGASALTPQISWKTNKDEWGLVYGDEDLFGFDLGLMVKYKHWMINGAVSKYFSKTEYWYGPQSNGPERAKSPLMVNFGVSYCF